MFIEFIYFNIESIIITENVIKVEQINRDSPIFLGIGLAEGTRLPNGEYTIAGYYHIDPGNKAINIGTCSYQHLPPSYLYQLNNYRDKIQGSKELKLYEIADDLCLESLNRYKTLLINKAQEKDLSLTKFQLANGIDLANQSPEAAFSVWGYLDRLKQSLNKGLDGVDAIIEARTWSYWDPNQNRWAAPGLGNTYLLIKRDQRRRTLKVNKAFD